MSAIRLLRWLLLLLALLLFGPLYLLVVILAKDDEPFAKRDVVLCVQIDKSALCQLARLSVVDWLLQGHN